MVPVARFCSFSMRKKILKNVKKNYVKKNFFFVALRLNQAQKRVTRDEYMCFKKKFGPKRPFLAYLARLKKSCLKLYRGKSFGGDFLYEGVELEFF